MQQVRFNSLWGFNLHVLLYPVTKMYSLLEGIWLCPLNWMLQFCMRNSSGWKGEGLGSWETKQTFLGRKTLAVQPSLRPLLSGKHSHWTSIKAFALCTVAHSCAELLSLVLLFDTPPVMLSERILCVGKDGINNPSITVCVKVNFPLFLE